MTRARSLLLVFVVAGLTACAPRVEPPGADVALAPREKGREVRFLAVGDTGDGSMDQARVAAAMAATCRARGCDFVLLLGDNVYPRGPDGPDDPALERVIGVPYAGLGVPVFAALGNHDDGGSGWSPERGDAELAWTKRPPWWRTPARYYRLSAGEVDVARWLATPDARWKVVAGHHPYLSNGKHGDAGRYDGLPSLVPVASGRRLRRFLDDVVCGKADVYLSAHDHTREWMTETCKGTELVVSGAGARPRPIVSRRPARFTSGALGYFALSAGPTALTGELLDEAGRVDFARTLPPR